jgi:hypothetical protein
MDDFTINLMAEPRTLSQYLMHAIHIVLEANTNGLFVNKKKVTDVFFNGIQLRLYTRGSFAEHEKNKKGLIIFDKNCDYYLVYEENGNDSYLSFEELHLKVEDCFILAP